MAVVINGNGTVTGVTAQDELNVDSDTLVVDSTNNRVGIGTSSAGEKLDVQDTANVAIRAKTTNTNGIANLILTNDAEELRIRVNGGNSDALEFCDGTTARMVMTPAGNVGIGTTNPDTKLNLGFSGADDVNTLRIEGSNGSSERFAFDIQADGAGSAAKFLVGSGGGTPSERMRIDSSGKLLMGKTVSGQVLTNGIELNPDNAGYISMCGDSSGNPPLYLANKGTSGTRVLAYFYGTSALVGSITHNGSSTSYNTSSDYRLKENVVDMTGAIDRVKALQPRRFNFISDEDDTTVDGFLAHEVSSTVPEAISGTHNEVDEDGNPVYQGIDQSKLVPLLTGALQEAITKIEALETTVADLTTRIETLENA